MIPYTTNSSKSEKRSIVEYMNYALESFLQDDYNSAYHYCEKVNELVFSVVFNNRPEQRKPIIKNLFPNAFDLIYNEYKCVCKRIDYFKTSKFKVPDYEVIHTLLFYDYFLSKINIISAPSKELQRFAYNYLNTKTPYFNREDRNKYEGFAEGFYRNAYRVERYSHELKTNYENEGFIDLYTPLILTRMAIEQFCKLVCDKKLRKISKDDKITFGNLLSDLKKAKIFSEHIDAELFAIKERGNFNTHSSDPNYSFAVIHGLGFIKNCHKEIDNKYI